MGNLHARIADLIAKAGPATKQELVYSGEQGKDDYVEYGTFTFRRLPYNEVDRLRLDALDGDGKFNRDLYAGSNARLVSRTLVDDETLQPVFTYEEINTWPGPMVDAFTAASNRVNVMTVAAAKAVAKNSDATPAENQ